MKAMLLTRVNGFMETLKEVFVEIRSKIEIDSVKLVIDTIVTIVLLVFLFAFLVSGSQNELSELKLKKTKAITVATK